MPIPTSSMYQNAATGKPDRRQQARQLWAEFRLYAMKARKGMNDRRTMALQELRREWQTKPARSQKEREEQKENLMRLHEKQHFLEMREEWQRMLHSNGLQHEDWGEVTPTEMAVIRQILGPDDIEEEEEEEEEQILVGHSGSHNYHPPRADFVPANVAAQPLSQSVSHQSQTSISSQSSFSSNPHSYAAPSLASRSQNSSSASYAFVDPSKFTDDERDDFATPFLGRRAANYTQQVNTEDERNGVPIPAYKTWTPSSQHRSSGYATHHNSNPPSLSSSPVDAPASRSFHQPSSLSSTSHFPHVPSSLSKPVSVDDDADRIFASAVNGMPSSSSAVAGTKGKSKLRSGYIGPQVTTNESENEADADFASMSKANQIATYEKFKREARVKKIREFHEEAAKLDIELAEKISVNSDKTWMARIVAQHEQDMLRLRAEKEEERRRMVHDERNRMTAEIHKGRNNGPNPGSTGMKKGWAASSKPTNTKAPTKPSTAASSAFAAANKTPIAPTAKPRTPISSASQMGAGFMNFDELQNVLNNAPDMPLDTAFQITQLIGSDGAAGAFDHNQEHDQEWGTPQLHHNPGTNSANGAGPRKRTDSVSVLEDSRFGTISAKGKQRRGTITVSTVNESNNSNGFWKPQAQPPSPEESEAMTDQFAKAFLSSAGGTGGPPTRTSASRAAMRQGEDSDDFFNGSAWNTKPAVAASKAAKPTSANNNTPQISAWMKKPVQTTGTTPPPAASKSGWGAKKTLGALAGWNQEAEEEEGEEEEEEEEELVRPSPFGGSGAQKRGSSLLSDMMAKGRSAVAGAVGAALGPMSAAPSPVPPAAAANQLRKNGAQMSAVSTPPPTMTTSTTSSAAAKKGAKKSRQTVNKKTTPISPMSPEEDEEEPELHPQMTTPRAAASSTKFTSAWGPQNNSQNTSFGPGSPSSRNAVPLGGMWDDMVSTTPKPGSGLSGVFGGHNQGIRRPSGLHNQVWNAEGEEEEEEGEQGQEEEQEEEVEEEKAQWNMPGSLNARGGFGTAGAGAGRFGSSMTSAAAKASAKKNTTQSTSGWGTWGSANTSTSKPTSASTTNSKKVPHVARKPQVTMEEIPDESERPDRSPSKFLAHDSRSILEPKPSKPSAMFEDIIQFGAEPGSSPEDMRNRPLGGKQRASASASAQFEQGAEDIDPAILQRAAMEMRKGEKLFSASSGPAQTRNGANSSARGGPVNKSNNAWGSSFAPDSFNDPSSFDGGPPAPPKAGSAFGAQKQAPDSAWGFGASSSPKVETGFGFGKAKPTTGTSGGVGSGGFGWGPGSTSAFGGGGGGMTGMEDDPWGTMSGGDNQYEEENDENPEKMEEIMNSKKKLQELFGSDSTSSKPTTKPAAAIPKTATARAKAMREQRDREERERLEREEREAEEFEAQAQEEREAQEREEREAQERAAAKEKEAKEKEAAAATAAAAAKPTGAAKPGAKRGKGKKR